MGGEVPSDTGDAAAVAPSEGFWVAKEVRDPKLDYLHVPLLTMVWAGYLAFVGGTINGVAMSGLFEEPATHLSGMMTKAAERALFPPKETALGTKSLITGWLLGAFFMFMAGAATTGFILTEYKSEAKRHEYIKIYYPTPASWRWQHQLLITIEIVCLLISFGIMESRQGVFELEKEKADGLYFFAFILCLYTTGVQNALITNTSCMVLRSSHITGATVDTSMTIGFLLRTRDRRMLWKIPPYTTVVASFFFGCMLGAAVYHHDSTAWALLISPGLLFPLWLAGAVVLVMRRSRDARAAELTSIGVAGPAPK